MKAAIVILNWNGIELLKRFLEIVIRRSPEYAAVIVADNGSDDGSVEWMAENHPDIRIIKNNTNYGFAEGYNRALENIDAEYFILLNSDVEVTKNWLEPVVEYLDTNPDVAACQPKILSYENRKYFEYAGAAGGYIDKYGYPFCRGRILDIVEEDKGQYNDRADIFWASGACMIIRSSVWKETGGFDSEFFAHMEEIDLCWRIHSSDHRIVFIPEAVVYHIGGATLPYQSPTKLFYNFRNNLFLLHKNLPDKNFRKILFLRKILDGVAAVRFLLMFNYKAFRQVWKSHMSYYSHKSHLEDFRNSRVKKDLDSTGKLILNKSLIISFYLKRKRSFNKIWPEVTEK